MSETQSTTDLQHFLRLAAAQVRYRLVKSEASEPYSSQTARLRLLEELIMEQIPNEDTRSSARAPR
jgi:hypothetical protein